MTGHSFDDGSGPDGGPGAFRTDGGSEPFGLDDGSGPFRLAYDPGAIRYGEGAVASLGEDLGSLGHDRALVVTGRTVGRTAAMMDPIREGLDDRLAAIFAETGPEKRLSTAVEGAAAVRECDADVLVAVGGGSSIDTAKAIATVAGRDDDPGALGTEFAETGTLAVPDDPLAIVSVPTTLAGADFTQGAGLAAAPEGDLVDAVVAGGIGGPALAPVQATYDPLLFARTPWHLLAGSAMNGFDKALETCYSRHATAITDATAARGLRRFRRGLLAFPTGDGDGAGTDGAADSAGNDGRADGAGTGGAAEDPREAIGAAVEGLLLAQYGISRADCTTMSVIHAFGQAVSAAGEVQQGVAHAVCAPHVLTHLFETCDLRVGLLADALGVGDAPDPASATVGAVTDVRDALGVTTRLRDVEGLARDDLDGIAAAVHGHRFLENGPAAYDPSVESLEGVLDAAW